MTNKPKLKQIILDVHRRFLVDKCHILACEELTDDLVEAIDSARPKIDVGEIWKVINSLNIIDIDDYEFRDDYGGRFYPSDMEKILMNDYTQRVLKDVVNVIAEHFEGGKE